MIDNPDSILLSTKKLIHLDGDYEVFDIDIITHINTIFMILNQMGVGPKETFQITGDNEVWDDFTGGDANLNPVKSYMALKVQQMFDQQTGAAGETIKEVIKELEFRLHYDQNDAPPDPSQYGYRRRY